VRTPRDRLFVFGYDAVSRRGGERSTVAVERCAEALGARILPA